MILTIYLHSKKTSQVGWWLWHSIDPQLIKEMGRSIFFSPIPTRFIELILSLVGNLFHP